MKLPGLPGLGLAAFRRRILFRGAFLLLIAATLALAVILLKEEKQRSYDNYRDSFMKTKAEVVARLRHPAGQLALLNPDAHSDGKTSLHPLLLPYAALDFDELNKAQQAVEMAGCAVQYEGGASVCVAVGSNPFAGGFIYLVGSFLSNELVGHPSGSADLSGAHRMRVSLSMRGTHAQWLAPFELQSASGNGMIKGRLTGFEDTEAAEGGILLPEGARPVRDFRGWLWQGNLCATLPENGTCQRRSFFSIRLPVEVYSEALFQKARPVWPPPDLDQTLVHIEVFAPDSVTPLFDSNAPSASPPFSLNDLAQGLLPGEKLSIRKRDVMTPAWSTPVVLKAKDFDETVLPWLYKLVRLLPVEGYAEPLAGSEIIRTNVGDYEVTLSGDLRSIDRGISITAMRMLWFFAAMLAAIILAWLAIEIGLIRRIAVLTRRAAAVSDKVQDEQGEQGLFELDVGDLRGPDELGILAGGLSDLLQRVKADVQREQIRAQQERDMWQAVGHEIMSPLQSLMVLHASESDGSHRYVQRMQQAVRVLYGAASPSEALAAAALQVNSVDVDVFLANVAANAPFAGIDAVAYVPLGRPVPARADEFPLEDAVTHILRNADRYRPAGTPITLSLAEDEATVVVRIANQGPQIDPGLIDRIFEYGVSDAESAGGESKGERRGQGLFVAKTYMAKMGGTIAAENLDHGVVFTLTLQRAP